MKKKHSIRSCFWTSEDVSFMAKFGFQVKENEFSRIVLDEDDTYEQIHARFLGNEYFFDNIFFEYDKEDVFTSDYCVMNPLGGGGYPQPEGTWYESKKDFFDMSEFCWGCGANKVQTQDFRINKISKKPVWGFTAWIGDVLFTTEDFYKEVFEPLGIGCRTVRRTSGKIYSGILQLVIPVIDENLDMSMHMDREICPVCGDIKFGAKDFYPFFPLPEHPLPHIFLTKEHFGYGHEAFRRTIVSRELVQILLKNKVTRFDNLIPCRRNLSDYLKTIKY